jgi:penicillin amidase
LTTVVRTLRGQHGDDSRRWTWGRVRPLTLVHPIGERGLLGRVFNLGPFPWGGDTNTISQGGVDLASPDANSGAIAAMRMVVDVGNWEASRFVLPGGQSDNPTSPHYDDMLPLWQRGDGVPIAWSLEEVDRVTKSTLRLLSGPPLKAR